MAEEAHNPLDGGLEHCREQCNVCFLDFVRRNHEYFMHRIPEHGVGKRVPARRLAEIA